MSDADVIHPTLLMVGSGEPMDAALRVALDRHGLRVEESIGDVKASVRMAAPDVVFLVGDAAQDGGRAILDILAIDPVTNVVPVIVLGHAEKLDSRVTAFRSGAVAVVKRTASADQIASRVAEVTRELGERGEAHQDELGEATFDELVSLVAQELRSGILSVGRANKAGEPMRIVLGAGRPVADAVEEFVRKLRPLVSRAEPLVYELHASTGGPVGLLDPEPGGHGDLGILAGLRIILVDGDASRADTLAQQLRGHGSVVAVADPSSRGLERARGLDPEVVIVDAAGIEGPGFEVVRSIRSDLRLRWAAMLVAPWADIWPESAQTPDLAELVERIRPLVVHDQALRERAKAEPSFDTRLEATGPSRLLRVLASLPGPFHVSLRSRKATVELDVAEGLVVGARATREAGDVIEGTRALAAMLAMASARVHIEKKANPSIANLMSPVEEALASASKEASPIPPSVPPPPMEAGARGARPKPFPTASEVGRGLFEDDTESSGPIRSPMPARARVPAPKGAASSRDLKWTESESGDGRASVPQPAQPAPQGLFSNAQPTPAIGQTRGLTPRAALSAFGETKKDLFPKVGEAAAPDESTRIYPSDELAKAAVEPKPSPRRASAPPDAGTLKAAKQQRLVPPPPGPPPPPPAAPPEPPARPAPSRKPTLVMGANAPTSPPSGKAPLSRPPLHGTGATMMMGTADPTAPPPAPSDPPAAAARFPAPGVLDQLGTTAVPTPPSKPGGSPRTLVGLPRPERNPITSDFERDESTDPAAAPFGDRTDTNVAPYKPEAFDSLLSPEGGAPAIPPSAIIQGAPRARVVTPMLTGLSGGKASDEPLGAPALPPLLPSPVPPAPGRSSPGLAAPDPTPLGVITAPAPPSGVRPPQSAPPPAAPPSEARAPRPSIVRRVAWFLVTLGALALFGALGFIGWTRFGADLLASYSGTGPIAIPIAPLAGPDSAIDVDAAVVVAVAEVDAAAALATPVDAAVAPAIEPVAPENDAGVDAFVAPEVAEVPAPAGDETAEQLVARAEASPDAQAEPLYRQAIELDPRNHYAMLGLAGVLMRRGAAAEAIPFIESAIRRRGRRAEYRVLLGDARRDSGDMEGARQAWREALEIDPEDHTAQERLGQ